MCLAGGLLERALQSFERLSAQCITRKNRFAAPTLFFFVLLGPGIVLLGPGMGPMRGRHGPRKIKNTLNKK